VLSPALSEEGTD
jgi:serine/threonine-protein kinase RsbW